MGFAWYDNRKSKIENRKLVGLAAIAFTFVLGGVLAEAQQTKAYRIGILVPGEAWYEIIDGLRVGLKQQGLAEGKQFVLAIRDWQGDAKVAEEAARNFEQEKIDLIYTTSTNSTITARRATTEIPIVFCAGTDPVVVGLVDSFAKPGGRLTGVYHPSTDLTAKRLEILKEMVPKVRRVVIFYDPSLRTGIESSKLAREAAQQTGLQLVERHFATVKELQASVHALKAGDADAYLAVSDPTASNQARLIIDMRENQEITDDVRLPKSCHQGRPRQLRCELP